MKKTLQSGAERQPDKTAWEGGNDEQQAKGQRLLESTPCGGLKIGSNCTGADAAGTLCAGAEKPSKNKLKFLDNVPFARLLKPF